MPSIRNFCNHVEELTDNLETRILLVNNGKIPLFFDLMVIHMYLLSDRLKNPSCFSRTKRTPSFSNLCEG